MGEKYQILVDGDNVSTVIDDWMYHGRCDITFRIAKTKGCRVIETTDALYAARIYNYLKVAKKVNVVEPKNKKE